MRAKFLHYVRKCLTVYGYTLLRRVFKILCYSRHTSLLSLTLVYLGSARGVMVIVAGIGHGDTSSNPGLVAFHIALIPLGKV